MTALSVLQNDSAGLVDGSTSTVFTIVVLDSAGMVDGIVGAGGPVASTRTVQDSAGLTDGSSLFGVAVGVADLAGLTDVWALTGSAAPVGQALARNSTDLFAFTDTAITTLTRQPPPPLPPVHPPHPGRGLLPPLPSQPAPFTITVYDRQFGKLGTVGAPLAVKVTPRHMQPGTATVTFDPDAPRASDLGLDGARVVITYASQFAMSGRITAVTGNVLATEPRTVDVLDDFHVLSELLGWPHPTAPIAEQGQDDSEGHAGAYFALTGPAETVVKGIVGRNALRLGVPLTMAPDAGRGQTVTVSVRMHPTADRILPVLADAGIGITVRQQDGGLVLDCYAQTTYPRTLSSQSGVITGGSWSRKQATATRAVVGGGGEGVNRDFVIVTDPALEATLGTKIEVFVDARDAGSDYYRAVDELADKTRNVDVTAGVQRQALTDRDLRYLDWVTAAVDDKSARQLALDQAQAELDAANAALLTATNERDAVQATLPGLQATYMGVLQQRGADKLKESAPTASVALTLSETGTFRYGTAGLTLGAQVACEVAPGVVITDRITAAEMSWTATDGLLVTPVVGDRTDDPDVVLARAVQNLARNVRNLSGR